MQNSLLDAVQALFVSAAAFYAISVLARGIYGEYAEVADYWAAKWRR
jgi:hypothetical protein